MTRVSELKRCSRWKKDHVHQNVSPAIWC